MILSRHDPESARITAEFLRDNRLVILPTDTIYGFSGRVPETRNLIIDAKGRDEGKPFIQLIADVSDLKLHSDTPVNPELLALWPGAVTIIVSHREGGTVAFRCPGDPWLRKIVELTGAPIYSTSVNRSGQAALNRISEIIGEFGSAADLIIDAGDLLDPVPSTIVDATGPEYKILRSGAVTVPATALRA